MRLPSLCDSKGVFHISVPSINPNIELICGKNYRRQDKDKAPGGGGLIELLRELTIFVSPPCQLTWLPEEMKVPTRQAMRTKKYEQSIPYHHNGGYTKPYYRTKSAEYKILNTWLLTNPSILMYCL